MRLRGLEDISCIIKSSIYITPIDDILLNKLGQSVRTEQRRGRSRAGGNGRESETAKPPAIVKITLLQTEKMW